MAFGHRTNSLNQRLFKKIYSNFAENDYEKTKI